MPRPWNYVCKEQIPRDLRQSWNGPVFAAQTKFWSWFTNMTVLRLVVLVADPESEWITVGIRLYSILLFLTMVTFSHGDAGTLRSRHRVWDLFGSWTCWSTEYECTATGAWVHVRASVGQLSVSVRPCLLSCPGSAPDPYPYQLALCKGHSIVNATTHGSVLVFS